MQVEEMHTGALDYVFAEKQPKTAKAPLMRRGFFFGFACLTVWLGASASTMGKSECGRV
jgi:hypothetical protein